MTLYAAVGRGMTLFCRVRVRVEVDGELLPEPGTLYVSTHRSHLDVPVLISALWPRVRRRPEAWPWFAARDDIFLPGFFAHLAPGRVPLSVGIGSILEGRVRCLPVRPATRMRIVDLARLQPELPVEQLPGGDELRARASRLGRPAPRVADDVLASGYADLLWHLVDRTEAPFAGRAWAARLAQSRRDLERLVALLRAGESLVLFPEGTPSGNGRVGPVQRGTGLLVRRGRPRRIVPIGIVYENGRRRMRARIHVGEPVAPPAADADVESAVHALLRETVREVERVA